MTERKVKVASESRTVMTEMIMPNDTNPLGNLMGGYLMRWMDIAAAICAAKHCESQVVTASVDNVSFHDPIKLGEVITLHASVTRAFNTSVEIFVEVLANRIDGSNPRKCNQAYLTFVAINSTTLAPQEVPVLKAVSSDELKHYEGAARRREIRLILSGRMKPADAKEVKSYFEVN
ncbi:MAG: acyl-CoA thioesterase [Saprospiraceae bacterium]|nr:acyl-CoA thioesterase [Saprospiraceae bacterium]